MSKPQPDTPDTILEQYARGVRCPDELFFSQDIRHARTKEETLEALLYLALEAVGPHESTCPSAMYYDHKVHCDCGLAEICEALVSAFKGKE